MTEKIQDLFLKMTAELASLNTNMKSVLDRLSTHEQRLCNLEQNKSSLKDTAVAWLVKGLVASIFVIGSLTGSATILTKLLGVE